jgi:WD40 repeat protein
MINSSFIIHHSSLKKMNIKKIAHLTGHRGAVYALSQASEHTFFSAGSDGWVVLWDLQQPDLGKAIAKVDAHLPNSRTHIFSMCYLKQNALSVVGDMNGGVHFIDLKHPEQTKDIAHHQKSVFDIQLINNELCTIGGDGILTYWSIIERKSLESIQLSTQALRTIAYCPTRKETAIGSSDGNIYILDQHKNLQQTVYKAHQSSAFTLQYSLDGQFLLSGGRDAMLTVRHTNDYDTVVLAQPAHWFTINKIAFHPKGHLFATASRDKTVKIWETGTWKLLKVLDTIRYGCHIHSINNLLWIDNQLISASDDSSLMVWAID